MSETTNICDWVNLVACGCSYFKVQDDQVYVYDQYTKTWEKSCRTLKWIHEKTYKVGEQPKRTYF